MAETPTPKKWRLKTAKYTRLEKGAIVLYEKGAIVLLSDSELAAFSDKFEEVADQKTDLAKPEIIKKSVEIKDATTPAAKPSA